MKKMLFAAMFLLIMVGFNSGNVFASVGGSIASLLMEAGGGGRTAEDSGIVSGSWWSTPYTDALYATDGDYSTYAYGSITGDGTGNNKICYIKWDMGAVFDVSIITIKADITGTPHGNMFIEVSQDGVSWIPLPGFQIGVTSSSLQKEATILCPYRIRYVQVVCRTSYSDPSNIYIYELTVR